MNKAISKGIHIHILHSLIQGLIQFIHHIHPFIHRFMNRNDILDQVIPCHHGLPFLSIVEEKESKQRVQKLHFCSPVPQSLCNHTRSMCMFHSLSQVLFRTIIPYYNTDVCIMNDNGVVGSKMDHVLDAWKGRIAVVFVVVVAAVVTSRSLLG